MTSINPESPNNPDAPLKVTGLAEAKASWDEDLAMFGVFDLSRDLTPTEIGLHHDLATFNTEFDVDTYERTIETTASFSVDRMGTVVAKLNTTLELLEQQGKEVDDRIKNTEDAATVAAAGIDFD